MRSSESDSLRSSTERGRTVDELLDPMPLGIDMSDVSGVVEEDPLRVGKEDESRGGEKDAESMKVARVRAESLIGESGPDDKKKKGLVSRVVARIPGIKNK